ncbi:MAG TPA: hypothetical protein VGC56_18430 [Allosphingosinicella sp.]|jgi:hypothetical protein
MKGSTNRRLRRLHQYLGLFFAPTLLLFSLSGALQTYRWQEPKGYGGSPPSWIVWMASVHKDQASPRPPPAAGPEAGPPAAEAKAKAPAGPEAKGPPAKGEAKGGGRKAGLMLFVGLFGLALFVSTLLGIAIALANANARRTNLAILAAGIALPLLLLYV